MDFCQSLGLGDEKYCRYLWSFQIKDNKRPWRAYGKRESGKAVTKLSDFFLDAEAFVPERGEVRCSVDCFYSPNEFFDWRKTEQLSLLHANWLEIDTAGHKILTLDEQETVIAEVFEQLSDAQIPLPNSYTTSGSGGLHLYWIYSGVEAFKWRVNIWREITSKLIGALSGGDLWEIDCGASRDPARVLRYPGTMHSKSGRTVKTFMCETPIYDFDMLAAKLSVDAKKPSHLIVVKPQIKDSACEDVPESPAPANNNPNPNLGRHTIGQWWSKILMRVLDHSYKNGVAEGRRDATLFISYVALRHIKKDEADALAAILSINIDLGRGRPLLDEKALKAYLSTATTTHYKYRKDTLADYLEKNIGMSAAFLYEDGAVKLGKAEVALRRSQGAINAASVKKASTLSSIQEALQGEPTATQARVAEITGKGIATVKRHWKAAKVGLGIIRPASIYSPS